MKKRIVLFMFLCIGILNTSFAESDLSEKDSAYVKPKRPLYVGVGIGNNISSFRDFATSPLFYKGTAKTISVFVDRPSDKKDMFIQVRYSAGKYKVKGLDDDEMFSQLKSASVRYSMLWKINPL